jgi:membrane associated rhomboid family serine protease
MFLLFALVGVSLVFAMLDGDLENIHSDKYRMARLFVPTGHSVWHEGRVWTLVTGPFMELHFASLLLNGVMIWLLLPTLERWWGPKRFAFFVGVTAIAGTIAGTLVGLATGPSVPVSGFGPTIFASAIAFGILYARQPIQIFGVLPMTGRQFMYGMIGLVAVFILIGQDWEEGAAMAAAMLAAAALTSGKLDPITIWRRWRYERARAHLKVVPRSDAGDDRGASSKRKRRNTDERFLN